jgi:hypothetical protein
MADLDAPVPVGTAEEMPAAAFMHTVHGFFGEELTIVAYAPVDDEDGGAVEFVIRGEHGRTAGAHISSPAEREAFAKAWMQACRVADGEKPATEARDDGDDFLSVANRPELLRQLFGQPATEAAGPDEWVCEDCGLGWTYPTPPDDDSECDTCGGSLCPN